ncbi:MAG: GspE/PulE family protein [Janthinobacterium lividum]
MNQRAFAEKLVNAGLVAAAEVEPMRPAAGLGTSSRVSWGRHLLAASRLKPDAFADLLAESQNLPRAGLDALRRGTSLAGEFSLQFLHDAGLFPYRASDGSLRIAVADPFDVDAIDAVAMTLGGGATIEVASLEDVEIALDAGARAADAEAPEDAAAEVGPDNSDSLRDLASGAPVVRALDDVFDQAVSLRASDIHVEPLGREVQIRVRVDGVLRVIPTPRAAPARALVSRIKILAGLNIAEHRQPQDGRMRIKVRSRDFDVRVATMPTTRGEAAILRLLDRGGRLVAFSELGFNPRDRAVLTDKLAQPHGMIVVTGPTGSGKTTTLTAALASLNDSTRKILTVEDPVEYEIPGVNQSQVRPAVGLTFATALRAFMRQDPDVIMVGEIRDPETAKIAVQASLTGHLVMTTLHTNTAAAAITRLVDIGVERYLIASTLTAVVGQRLIRTLCLECRRPFTVGPQDVERNPRIVGLGLTPGTALFEPGGCERCGGTGYRGRRAIFECLDITEPVRREILAGADDVAIERAGIAGGMATLVEDGKARCLEGITSVDEVFRVAALR